MKSEPITVEHFYDGHMNHLGLKLIAGGDGLKRIIQEPTVSRPGLFLAGFPKHFAPRRVQLMGRAEVSLLHSFSPVMRSRRCAGLLAARIPCLVFCWNLKADRPLLKAAEAATIPVFQSPLHTTQFLSRATLALEAMFAPRGSEIGGMVDIFGVGVMIKGESGIGKSESVLALIERGYSIVSDDITLVSLVDGREVVGASPEVTRNHMEVRGIGIIDVAATFGIRSVRQEKRVDLVVTLKAWEDVPNVDRLGIDNEFMEILGVKIPHIVIPVRPGRDIARLIEVAALHQKLKALGHNPARALDERIRSQMNPHP